MLRVEWKVVATPTGSWYVKGYIKSFTVTIMVYLSELLGSPFLSGNVIVQVNS